MAERDKEQPGKPEDDEHLEASSHRLHEDAVFAHDVLGGWTHPALSDGRLTRDILGTLEQASAGTLDSFGLSFKRVVIEQLYTDTDADNPEIKELMDRVGASFNEANRVIDQLIDSLQALGEDTGPLNQTIEQFKGRTISELRDRLDALAVAAKVSHLAGLSIQAGDDSGLKNYQHDVLEVIRRIIIK